MSLTISALSRCAVPVVIALGSAAVPASADAGTVVPMRSILRACDYSPIPAGSSRDTGTASAVIHASGGAVTADIHFADASAPGGHYVVSLIQMPQAASAACDAPGPGVAVGALNSDGGGVANTTLHDSLRSGTTGVWVFIRQPSPISQSPAQFYTSDFLAKV